MHMGRRLIGVMTVSLLVLGALPAGAAVKVDLTVKAPAGADRKSEWVTAGVPLAQGAARDAAALRLSAGDQPVPAQFKVQCRWPDESLKWVLCSFPATVPAEGEARFTLTDAGAPAPAAGRLSVKDGPEMIEVETGAIAAKIDKRAFRLLSEVTRGGQTLLKQGQNDGAVLYVTADRKINAADLAPEAVVVEENGPRRVCVMARGKFNGAMQKDGAEMIRWTCRLYFHEGSDEVRVVFTLGNDGAMGANQKIGREYFKFDALKLDFGLALGAAVQAASSGAAGQPRPDAAFAIRQKGAYAKEGIFEAVLGATQLASADRRDEGWLALSGANAGLSLAVRDFWQNYPKELTVAPDRLSVGLWPEWGGYPELQGVYNLCGGRQKTHDFTISFGGGEKERAAVLARQVNRPLLALASAEYYADCGALGLFSPAGVVTGNAELDAAIKKYDDLQRVKPAGLTRAANDKHKGSYYNWVNWGDLNWSGGSCSLHYDWTHIMLLHGLRTGQRDLFDWGFAMARHQHDIDLPRSPRDMSVYRYVSTYEKETSDGGPTGWHISTDNGSMIPTCSHHWIQGQCLYAALTGDPEAWVAVRLSGAEAVRNRILPRFDRETQARSLGWGMECLLSVYAYTGDKSCLDDAKTIFEKGLWPMFAVKKQKSGDMGDRVQTSYIVEPLIAYHWHTGDPRAIEMLKAMVDKSDVWSTTLEYMIFGDGAAYVYHRTGEERFLTKAREVYFADSLVGKHGKFYVNSGAWTKEQAKTSRSGNIHLAIERLKTLGKSPVK